MQHATRSRIKAAVLLLAVFLPITLASFAYRSATSGGGFSGFGAAVNNGNLILPPADVSDLDMRDAAGQLLFESFENIVARLDDPDDYATRPWTIVYMNSGACEAECRERVHLLRQMHVGLGKHQERVGRYYLNLSGADLPPETLDYLQTEFPGQGLAYTEAATVRQNLARHGIDITIENGVIMFVDPVGNVMMYYNDSHTIEQIKSDLDRLLAYSSLG